MSPETKDTLRAKIERFLSPGISTCSRCLRPWRMPRFRRIGCNSWEQLPGLRFYGWVGVKAHATNYSISRGCLPLCEGCWSSLTPETRLPYYDALLELWESLDCVPDAETHTQIHQAVMNGL